ncbi:MAG: DUF6088 family protein [Candidatus Margulisbacteria bacterium]|jgi:hypothetical protein|nr:DUF6088 family protein [Candidatus Margulisiibacteriota bacterium]
MKKSVQNRIFDRIRHKRKNWVFSPKDFTKDFSRWEIDHSLHFLEKEGKIKRIIRGLYYYPDYSEILQEMVAPDIHLAARALARKYEWKIYPDGDAVLNYLGLSTQFVAQTIYLSDGPSKTYTIDGAKLKFKHKTLIEAKFKRESSLLVVQAIKAVGERQITDEFLKALSTKYKTKEWQKIKNDTGKVAGWVYRHITYIADKLSGGK